MMAEEKKVEERDMTGWSEEDIKRYNEFVEGFISACKEVRAMRDGRLPEPTWDELKARLEKELEEEERLEREASKSVIKGNIKRAKIA